MASVVDFLNAHPAFETLTVVEKTKILPFLGVVQADEGYVLFSEGDEADFIYFPENSQEILGIDGMKEGWRYNSTVIAHEKTTFVKISSKKFLKLMEKYPKLSMYVLTGQNIATNKALESEQVTSQTRVILAWIMAAIIPLLIYAFVGRHLEYSQKIFVSIFSAGVAIWIFNVVHESIPGLLIVTVVSILNIMPDNNAIVSGFSSETSLLFLSISGLSAIMISSGLLYRFSLLIIRYTPRSLINVVIFVLGAIITPVVPSIVNRTQIIVSCIKHIAAAFNMKPSSVSATKLSIACFFGTTTFSTLFVTGSLMNFVAMGFLPEQAKFSMNSIGWIKIAIVPCSLLLLANMLAFPLIFNTREKPSADTKVAKNQIELLGPITHKEHYSLWAITLFYLAIILTPFHHMQFVWISMFLLIILFSLNCTDIKDWSKRTNWGFFLFISSVTGICAGIKGLGLDAVLKSHILSLTSKMEITDTSIITCLILLCLVSRMMLPSGPSFVVMMSIASPIAEIHGINIIAITFILLIVSDAWFFPDQAQFYTVFENEFEGRVIFNKKTFLVYNIVMNMARVGSVYMSMPYWRYIGIM